MIPCPVCPPIQYWIRGQSATFWVINHTTCNTLGCFFSEEGSQPINDQPQLWDTITFFAFLSFSSCRDALWFYFLSEKKNSNLHQQSGSPCTSPLALKTREFLAAGWCCHLDWQVQHKQKQSIKVEEGKNKLVFLGEDFKSFLMDQHPWA